MLDLYALPNDFPGFTECHSIADPYDRIRSLELRFGEDICDNRFVPYIQLHEFEALLFSDIRQLELAFIDQLKGITRLGKLAERFSNPELINDRPQTAPSKRIIAEIPDYEHRKPSAGPLVAAKIGMDNMRAKCAHFRDWLTRLEDLSSAENV
jgi:hypothetical protein